MAASGKSQCVSCAPGYFGNSIGLTVFFVEFLLHIGLGLPGLQPRNLHKPIWADRLLKL